MWRFPATELLRLAFLACALAVLPLRSTGAQVTMALADRGPRFLLAPASGGAAVEVDASRSGLLRRPVSLKLEAPTVGRMLAAIEVQTGLKFVYSRAVVPVDKPVGLRADSITVAAALTEILLDTNIDVVVGRDGQLTLLKRAAQRAVADTGVVAGRVTDKKTGAAIAGATVVVEGTRQSATTANDGRYRIAAVAPGTYTVRARYIGYAPASGSVAVNADQEATADFALEKSAQRLDEVVTTGTVVPTEVKALPNPITTVTSDQIQEQHIQRVDQLFRGDIPGMFAWDPGSLDYTSTVNVRGASSIAAQGYIKTYIDGVEMTDPTFLATLDPNSIEHLEVIRGPQASTIYGSDALNGVLQIFTKTGQFGAKPHLDGTVSGGAVQTKWTGSGSATTDQQDYSASLSGGGSQVAYSVGGSHIHTGEWVPEYFNTGNSLYGSVKGTSGAFTAEISGRYYHFAQGMPLAPILDPYAGPPFNFAPVNTDLGQETSTFGLTLQYRVTPRWTHVVTVGYDRFHQERDTRPRHTTPSDTLATLFDAEYSKPSVRYNTALTVPLGRSLSAAITAGADYYQRRDLLLSFGTPSLTGALPASGFQFASRTDYHNAGYFAQAQLGVSDHLFVTTGLRAEDNANFGQDVGLAWAPRVGLAYVMNVGEATLKARGSWGRAIRPPTQGQSDGGTDPFSVTLPNPALGPESQKGWDAGVELYYRSALSIQATYYRQTAEDLIDFVLVTPAATPVYQYQNVGGVNNRGWEFGASMSPLPGLTVAGTYSITTSRVAILSPTYTGTLQTGDQLLQIPKNVAGASVTYRLGRASATLGMTYVGSWTAFDDIALYAWFYGGEPARASLRDYWITYPAFEKYRLNLAFDVSPWTAVFVDVKNLTNNYAYETNNSVPTKGRTIVAGVHFGLGR